jgi:hypothetical protein
VMFDLFDLFAVRCKHGDVTCPCQDGDPCHYEPYGPDRDGHSTEGLRCPTSGKINCEECR